jgi:hypothetical protein
MLLKAEADQAIGRGRRAAALPNGSRESRAVGRRRGAAETAVARRGRRDAAAAFGVEGRGRIAAAARNGRIAAAAAHRRG